MTKLFSGRPLRHPLLRIFIVSAVLVTLGTSAWSITLADAGSYQSPSTSCRAITVSLWAHQRYPMGPTDRDPSRLHRAGGRGVVLPHPRLQRLAALEQSRGSGCRQLTPANLTVTPVYWVPGTYSIPSSYETLINRFITDAAAASGKTTDVFADLTQYTDSAGVHLKYLLHAGTPITDTDAFPTSGCTPDSAP